MLQHDIQLVLDVFTRFTDQPALVDGKTTLTWGQLYRRIESAVKQLEKLGFQKNDRVAILGNNQAEFVILCFALWFRGCVVVPISVRWPVSLIQMSLRVIACKKIITAPMCFFYDSVIANQEIANLVKLQQTDVEPSLIQDMIMPPEQECTIIFTSGSSGTPKAALHSFSNHYYSALGSNQNITFCPGQRWLLSLPLYHVGGMAILFRALVGGGCIAVPDPALALKENIAQLHVTHVSLVATQLYRLLQNEQAAGQLFGLQTVLLGGSAMPEYLLKTAIAHNLPVYTSYGSTEMASQITTTRPGDSLQNLLTSGMLLPHRELKIAADGEISVKGQTLFKGYIKKKFSAGTDANGWFATGDLGFIDEQGYLHVTGRKDNMFISGGENIHPEEIEAALLQQEDIIQALVAPVADQEYGFRPAAFVQCRSKTPDFEMIKKNLAEQLPKFKIPDHFFAWPGNLYRIYSKPQRHFYIREAARLLGQLPPGNSRK